MVARDTLEIGASSLEDDIRIFGRELVVGEVDTEDKWALDRTRMEEVVDGLSIACKRKSERD
jgi:hypothetical protein